MRADVQVVAVTVTYGERGALCVATVRAALAAGAESCIVVTNGISVAVAEALQSELADAPVAFVPLERNEGSAGGFAAGLEAGAARTAADLVWLLDDDNVAEPTALDVLLDARAEIVRSIGPSADPVLLAFRPDDAPEARMRDGGDPDAVYGPPGSVLYFDLFSRRRRRRPSAVPRNRVQVPYGPYGGLLVSRNAVRAVAGPRREFHLYEDDTEYTWRLARDRGLHVVFGAIVRDADGKWSGTGDDASGPARLLRAKDLRRRRFSVRNRVSFDVVRVRAEGGAVRFAVNVAVYVLVLTAIAVRERRFGALVDVLRSGAAGARLASRSAHEVPSAG